MTFLGYRLPVWLIFLIGFPLLWLAGLGIYAISPGPPSSQEQIEVIIPARSGVSVIGKILKENNVIQDDFRFSVLTKLLGASKKLRAGEYAFEPGKTPLGVIALLKKGKVLYRPVTIPEGTEMAKTAVILAKGGWVDSNLFLDLARDPEILKDMGIYADSLEGYLFPDTYYLSRYQQAEKEIIRMMVEQHFKVYNELVQNNANNPSGMTHHEVITLASIVEKETGNPEERALVASVFLNRLAKGMRLQADPTVRYGLRENEGPLSQNDLKNPTPYNTYIIKGLPPGPITNPGKAAIEAVMSPAESDYLYFVRKDDTSHHFSRNLKEHNRAVSRYKDRN
jgi:UPF0755 protein